MTVKPKQGPRRQGQRIDSGQLDRVVADALRSRLERHQGYREQSLRLHPWVCGRCGREFTRENLHELTVHHKDHNHDNNPADGSNWENLCLYCHDNEHRRFADQVQGVDPLIDEQPRPASTHKPFADLARLLGEKGRPGSDD